MRDSGALQMPERPDRFTGSREPERVAPPVAGELRTPIMLLTNRTSSYWN